MQRLYTHPKLTIVVLGLVVLGVGHRALFIQQDNSPETLFAADAEAKATYRDLVRTFGGDEVVLVQLRGARGDRAADLAALARLERRLRELPGVTQVLSPAQIYRPLDGGEATAPPDARQLEQVRGELAAIPLYRQLGLYVQDPPVLGALAVVVMRGSAERRALADSLDRIREEIRRDGYRPVVAGLAPANAAVDRELQRSLSLFMPLVAALSILIGWFLFRSVSALVAMFLPVLGALLLGVAALEIAGETLNLITAMMPPLVLAVGFAGAIHLVSHYAKRSAQDGLTPEDAVRATIREKFVPTAFAYGTTALGFASLGLSEMRSIQVLGLAAAGSLLAALALVTIGTPTFILLLKPRLRMPRSRREHLAGLAAFALRHRPWVLAVWAGVVAVMVVGLFRVRTNINGMDFLPAHLPERADYQRLEGEGVGLGNVDVWIHQPAADPAALLRLAPRLAAFAREVETAPKISAVIGAHSLLTIAGYRLSGKPVLPSSLAPLALLGTEANRRFERLLRFYWHPERGVKVTLLSIHGDQATMEEQRRRIRAAARAHFPGVKVDLSGHFAMLITIPDAVTRTLLSSLGVTVGVIALLFLLAFRSPWLALSGMIANLLPVLMMIGTMGWLGVPMDVATVMIGSVAFGIAVDDTFHYLYHRRKTGSILQAAAIAGQGIVATTLVLGGGFAVLALSGFNPVVRLGVLLSFGAFSALLVDAVLLPALVGCGEERRGPCAEAKGLSPPPRETA